MEISYATNKYPKLQRGSADPICERLNAKTALLGLFVMLTIVFASTAVYESSIRTTLTSTSTSTSTSTVTAISVSTSTSTTTTTSVVDPTKALMDAYLSHIGAIETENATALAVQYETNATLVNTDSYAIPLNPLNTSFDGIANITEFYKGGGPPGDPSLKAPFAVANETYAITMSNDLNAGNVTSHLIFYGDNPIALPQAPYVYNVSFDISYVLQGDHWLISAENVNYYHFYSCAAITLSSDGGILYCTYGS
jgi:hypothetical protein